MMRQLFECVPEPEQVRLMIGYTTISIPTGKPLSDPAGTHIEGIHACDAIKVLVGKPSVGDLPLLIRAWSAARPERKENTSQPGSFARAG